jgi:hypothetical protein
MGIVKFMRLHVDGAGESHMRREEMPLSATDFAPPAQPMEVSLAEAAVDWRFLHLPARWVGDWHPTPKRIWIYCLAGAMEFEASDGTVHRFEAGGVMRLEDTSGRGHRSRVIGDQDALLVAVQV